MPVNPWRDLRAWQDRLERLTSHHADSWTPAIDVYETPDRYVVAAELPGLTRDQIELAMADSQLTIRGQRLQAPQDDAHYHQVERGHGGFSRTFEFSETIDAGNVAADLKNGVLTIVLPKVPPPAARKIDVR
jgi:HSP20 family protein